jgi:PAS domain S-box-containing protein
VHPDDYKRSNDEFIRVFQHKKKYYSIEVRMKHRNGRWVWVLDSGTVIQWDSTGKPLIAAGTHIDITRTKKLQLRAEKNELKLRTIIENTKDIIYHISPSGIITYLSQAWTLQLGWPIQAVIGKSFRPYVHPEDLEKLDVFFDKIAKSKTHQEIQGYRLQTQKGEWRYFETSASPIVNQGKITGFAGIAAISLRPCKSKKPCIERRSIFVQRCFR